MDSKGRKVSLAPFVIEVINTNDRPFIYGTPDETIEIGKTYKFTPKVKDIDLDIAKDTLIFSIKNKPRWATFNKQTGTLNGNPIAYQDREGQTSVEIEESEEIIITVTDLYGASDSLKPFIIDIGHISTDILTEPIKSIRTSQISTTDVQIFSSHFDSVANNPNQSEANSTSLISDNNNLSQQIEHTDKKILILKIIQLNKKFIMHITQKIQPGITFFQTQFIETLILLVLMVREERLLLVSQILLVAKSHSTINLSNKCRSTLIKGEFEGNLMIMGSPNNLDYMCLILTN